MATGSWPTLADVTSRMTDAGEQHVIAEMLSQSVVLHEDAPYVEASEMTGHHFAYRTSIPAGAWRQMNQGTPYSKSTTDKSSVGLAELVDYSQVDRTLAMISGDVEGFRESEDVAFLEGMGQTIEQTLWYGNTVANPAECNGLSTFYNALGDAALNGANVIDGGGTGNSNASLWLLGWAPGKLFLLYPRGSKAGLAMEDLSESMSGYDSLGNPFRAYTMWFQQFIGLCPQDWRYSARMANMDVTTAGLAGPNAPDIFASIREMLLFPPNMTKATSGITKVDSPRDPGTGVRFVIYSNRTVRHYADIQAMRDRNVLLRLEDYAGKPTMGIDEIPWKVSDQLLTTEQRVT